MLEVRRWKLEVRRWKLDIRRWKLDIRSWKLDIRRWKLDVRRWKLEVRNFNGFSDRSTISISSTTSVRLRRKDRQQLNNSTFFSRHVCILHINTLLLQRLSVLYTPNKKFRLKSYKYTVFMPFCVKATNRLGSRLFMFRTHGLLFKGCAEQITLNCIL